MMYDLNTASTDWKRLWSRLRTRPTLLIVAFLSLSGIILLFGRSDPSTGVLQQLGLRETRARGPVSRHREPISIVLLAGANERSMIEVTRAILSTTVGPYELIGVFSGGDSSESIVSDIVRHHESAKVDRRDRGLRTYTSHSIYNSSNIQAAELHISALRSAKHKYVAIVNANDLMTEYGWDRILLTGLKSSADLMAISGRAGGNLEYERGTSARLIDGVGEPLPESHAEDASGPIIQVRQVALRSPILYDAAKLRDMGYTTPELEAAGMGDLDTCLRGRRDKGYKCGYYPVSVKTHENWKLVLGTAGFGLEMELSHSDIKMLNLDSHRFQDSELETFPAIRREIQDIPMTIVTAITASEIPYLKHLHTTLDWSTYTRYILYLIPTSTPICLSELSDLRGIEIRRFGFQQLPQWMQADKSIGEDALKFHMIKEVMEDYRGLVFWVDANKRLTSEMRRTWSDVANLGVWSTSIGDPSSSWTNPGTLAHFDLPISAWSGTNCNAGNMGFNSHHSAAMTKIVRPLFECASDEDCIAPPGISRANHRQDQAALTALVHLNGFSCDHTGPIEDQREKIALDMSKCKGPTF